MKADLSEFTAVAIDKVDADTGMPFPLYIYLKLNNRLIPLRHENDALFSKKDELLRFNLKDIWTPIYYYDRFKSLLEIEPKCEEAQLVHDILLSEELPAEVKAQALSALSQDLLPSLHQVGGDSEEEKAEGLQKCKEIAEEILTVASAHDSVYDEILTLLQSKEEIDHSVAVGSIGAMFAMSLGITDQTILADLIVAAIFHDIGLVHVSPQARQKSKMERSKSEDADYQSHVDKSIDVLQKSNKGFNQRIFTMVAQHHENYDGSGYPKALSGEQIDEFSQILNLANWFEDLTLGNLTGAPMAPAEALDQIYESSTNGSQQRINPELVERIFQFMVQQKDFFEQKKADAKRKADAEALKLVSCE